LDLCEGNAFIFIHAGDSAFNAGRYQLAAERWGRTEVSRQHVLSRIQSTIQSADWKAVSALAEILAATWPQAALGDYYHGLALMNLGDMRGAREALEQAADHIPSAGLEQQTAAEILQTLGRVYRYTGEDGLAESTLRAAIEADPLNSTAYVDMALLYRKANVRAALDMAKKAAEVNPKDVWAYLTIGDLALDTGEPQLALDMAKIAMSLQPNSSIPHLYAARASQMLGEYDLAFEFIEEGLVISSSSASAQQLLCYRLRISEEWEDNTQIALSRTKMAERGVDESLCK
jgi:tetratricopeptide (TPR) repeat protein